MDMRSTEEIRRDSHIEAMEHSRRERKIIKIQTLALIPIALLFLAGLVAIIIEGTK